jgi:NIMA (never in mitosis gene a)-related kinase
MELCDGGDVMKKIDTQKILRESVKEAEVWKFFVQMMRGLMTLHDMKIVHRDIKCANLFLTKSGDLKLGDLNVSKVAKQGMLST